VPIGSSDVVGHPSARTYQSKTIAIEVGESRWNYRNRRFVLTLRRRLAAPVALLVRRGLGGDFG
jgi:hypothetical protein